MADPLLLRQYTRLVQWIEALPPNQHALVIGVIWFAVFTITQLALGQPFFRAAIAGGASALVFAGVMYYGQQYR